MPSPSNSHALFSSICCLFRISRPHDLVFLIQSSQLRRAVRNKQLEFQIAVMVLFRNALFLHNASFFVVVNVMISSSGLLSLCNLVGTEGSVISLWFVPQFDSSLTKKNPLYCSLHSN